MALADQDVILLLQRVASQDQTALEAIYGAFQRRVFTMALMRLHGDEYTARDVVIRVFEVLWRKPHGYDPHQGPFIAWLLGIADKKIKTHFRANKRSSQAEDIEDFQDSLADPHAIDPAKAMEDKSRFRAMVECLDTLPQKLRDVVLALAEGKDYAEIGVMLNIKEGTVKSRMFNAREKLKPCVERREGKGGQR